MQLSYTQRIIGGVWANSLFCIFPACQHSEEALESPKFSHTFWHCCSPGPVLSEDVHTLLTKDKKAWSGPGLRPAKFLAEMATPDGAFRF